MAQAAWRPMAQAAPRPPPSLPAAQAYGWRENPPCSKRAEGRLPLRERLLHVVDALDDVDLLLRVVDAVDDDDLGLVHGVDVAAEAGALEL